MGAQGRNLFIDHAADIHPVVGLITRKQVDLPHAMLENRLGQLLREIHWHTCRGYGIKSTLSHCAVIRVDFIAPPGVKGEDNIWLPLTDNMHKFTPQGLTNLYFAIVIPQ